VKKQVANIVWPLPPDPPRIKYQKAIYSLDDVKGRGFFQGLKEFIIGGEGNQSIAKPYGVHAHKGKLYVADTVLRVVLVFDMKLGKMHYLGESGNGMLAKPIDVTTDKDDNVYVSDSGQNRIAVFDKDRKFVLGIGKKGELERPGGIAVNNQLNRLYVTDIKGHKITVFDLKGKLLFNFGVRGVEDSQFNFPVSIAVDKEGKVYVVDSMNFRVQVFDAEGKFLRKFGKAGDIYGAFARPKGIAVDSEGHIYIVDAAFNNVQIFDQEGKLLLFFGNMGYKPGELWLPAGIGIDENDMIYVADQYNHRIALYQFLKEGQKVAEKENIIEEKK
jgi:DNA-binding beta-propeller fold protein YncE